MSSCVSARLHRQRWIVPVRVLLVLLLATGSTRGLEVSVCRDATYDVPSDRGATICSGSGSQPQGSACPKANDVASRDCHERLSTFNGSSSYCVAQEDAECQLVRDDVWRCVFPTLGCATSPTLSYEQAQINCPMWGDVSLDDKGHFLRRLDALQIATEEDAPTDDSWFSMEAEPAALIACNRHPLVASLPPPESSQTSSTSDIIAPEPSLSPSADRSPILVQPFHPQLAILAATQQSSASPAVTTPVQEPTTTNPTTTPTASQSSPLLSPPTPVSPTLTPEVGTSIPSLILTTFAPVSIPTPTPNSTIQIPTQAPSTPSSTPTTAKPPVTPVPLPHTTPTPISPTLQLTAPLPSTPVSTLASLSPPRSTLNHTAPCPPAPSPTTANPGESTSPFSTSASPCPPTTELPTSPSVTPCPSSLHLHAHSFSSPLPPVASTPSTISQLQFSTLGGDSEQYSSAGIEAPASQSTATPSAIRVTSISQITATAFEDDDVLGEGTASTAAATATPTDSVELIVVVACGAVVAIAVAVFAVCKLRRFVRHDRLLRRKAGSTLATPVTIRSKFISAS